MAEKSCHIFTSTTRFGLTQALAAMKYLLALIVLFAISAPLPASACSCVPPGNVEQERSKSTRVFLGRVTSTEERTPQMDQGWWAIAIDWFKQLFGASPSQNNA